MKLPKLCIIRLPMCLHVSIATFHLKKHSLKRRLEMKDWFNGCIILMSVNNTDHVVNCEKKNTMWILFVLNLSYFPHSVQGKIRFDSVSPLVELFDGELLTEPRAKFWADLGLLYSAGELHIPPILLWFHSFPLNIWFEKEKIMHYILIQLVKI